jgi:hypothetical protein
MSLKKIFILCLFAGVFALGGCLKSTPYLDVSNTQPIIEFGVSPANGDFGPFPLAGDTVGSPVVVDTAVGLVIASPQPLNQAYSITVRIDTTQISAYNSANGTSYTLLPDSLYSMPDSVITIQAGHIIGRLPVNVNFPIFPQTQSYALPLTIVNGGGLLISGNASQFMWLFTPGT